MDDVVEVEIGPGPAPGTYTAHVLRSVTGGEPRTVVTLDVDALQAGRRHLEDAVLSSSVPTRRIAGPRESVVQEVGRRLFDAVFTGPVAGAYRASQGVARERGGDVQLVLRLTAPELVPLPWEALYDTETGAFVCRREPLVRHVPAPYTPDALAVRYPLRVLAVVASPAGLPRLDVEAERRRLEESLRPHVDAGRVELVWLTEVTWHRLHAALLQGAWHVLHFIGHGDYDAGSDEGVLAFVGEDGRVDPVEAGALADLLGEAEPTPRLVVLNSCESGTSGSVDPFSGTAAALVRSGIHAVAAMQFAVSDGAALAFSRSFYAALAAGRPVDEAVRSGRIGMLGTGRGTLEWITPVLYLRGGSGRLFHLADAPPAPAPAPASAPAPAPPEPTAPLDADPDPHRYLDADPDPDAAPHPERRSVLHAAPGTEPLDPEPSGPRRPARAPGGGRSLRGGGPATGATSTGPPPSAPGATPARPVRPGRRAMVVGAGVLAACGVAAAVALTLPWGGGADDGGASDPVPDAPVVLQVPADVSWTPTGVACEAGDRLAVDATGEVLHEQSATGAVGPDGLTDPAYHQYNVAGLPDANTVALIGRLDEGAPWVAGSHVVRTCDVTGELQLGVNDVGTGNNSGAWDVTITRIPHG